MFPHTGAPIRPSEKQIRDRLVLVVAECASLPVEDIDVRDPFDVYNLTSMDAIHVVELLEVWLAAGGLRVSLDPTLLWDHATIEAAALHLAAIVREAPNTPAP